MQENPTIRPRDANPPGISKSLVLFVVTVGAFLTPLMLSALNVALPAISEEFSLNAVVLGWIPTAYLLSSAMFLVPFGKLADMFGRRRVYLYGMTLFALAALLTGLAPSPGWLIAFRVLQGVGAAMVFGTGMAILTAVYPPGERGRAFGINVAAVYLGLSLGPPLGGVMTDRLGWRSIFFLGAFFSLVVVLLTLWKIRAEWAEGLGKRFDWRGSVLYSVALLALMWGFSSLPGVLPAVSLGVGVLLLVAFGWWETRVPYPIFDLNLFRRNRVFAFSNLAALINYSATFAVTFLMSLYFQYARGLGAERAGLLLIAQPAMMAIFSPLAGRLSDRVESRFVASAGMSLAAIGLFFLGVIGRGTSIPLILVILAVLGLGFALFSSPNTNTAMSAVQRQHYGVASATLGTMRLVGQMVSMALALLVFSFVIGQVQITADNSGVYLHAMRIVFFISAAMCFGGVFASMARGREERMAVTSARPGSGPGGAGGPGAAGPGGPGTPGGPPAFEGRPSSEGGSPK